MSKNQRLRQSDLDAMGLVWDEVTNTYRKKSHNKTLKVSLPVTYSSPVPDLTKPAQRTQELIVKFTVNPMGKPRMTQRDKFFKREVTDRYWELKRQLKLQAEGFKFLMPSSHIHVIFYLPMPDGWHKQRKIDSDGKPHQSRPDADNLIKALQDSLCSEDSYIWDVRITKRWAYSGSIEIYKINY